MEATEENRQILREKLSPHAVDRPRNAVANVGLDSSIDSSLGDPILDVFLEKPWLSV